MARGLMFTQPCILFVFGLTLLDAANALGIASSRKCGSTLRAGRGVISSPAHPGFPKQYPGNIQCEWIIIAPASRRVELQFSRFDLQSSSQCSADFVDVTPDGENANSSLSTVYCGQQLPPTSLSTGNVIRVRFVTDGVYAGSGFSAFYDTVAVDTPDPPVIVWLEQNLRDWTAKLQSLAADPADYLTTGRIVTNTLLKHSPANWTALAADYHNRHFFWADPRLKTIWRGQLDGEQLVADIIYNGISAQVTGLAVDWLARTIYWTDATYNHIMMSNYKGSRHTVVIEEGLDAPSGIAVHPQMGWLFWADTGNSPGIQRSRLDGHDRQSLVGSEYGYPIAISIDYPHDRMYWTAHSVDGTTSSIYWATIHGESVTVHTTVNFNQYRFNDVTVFKDYLFVTDSTNQLHCYFKDGTRGHYFTFDLAARIPFGITTYAENIQHLDSSGCDVNPCEYLCVNDGEKRYRCLCRQGFHAIQDGTCLPDSDIQIQPPKLFFLGRSSICMYPANFPDLPNIPSQCILRGLPHALAMATDVDKGILFYSTLRDNTIHSIKLRSNEKAIQVAGGTGEVNGIAVDWLSRLLYWTDSRFNHIAVSNYDGRQRHILLRDDINQPGIIAVDPRARYIFWTYLGSESEIERAGLDGTNRVVIVRDLIEPGGMSLDFNTNELYVAEKGTGIIHVVDYTGSGARRVFQKSGSMFTGMDLYKDYLIWTERSPLNELNVINRESGEHVSQHSQDGVIESAYGVTMYATTRQPDGQGPCSDSGRGCQQLCLPAPLPSNFVCACAIGYKLGKDGSSCTSDLVRENFILVTDSYLHGIFQVDLSKPDPTLQALLLVNISNPLSVAFDHEHGMVYWTDVTDGSISRALLHGGNQEVIVTSDADQAAYSLVVDSNSKLLYWTDTMRNCICACRLDGAFQITLVNTSRSPRALALLSDEGIMFYTWFGEDGSGIDKASMDGSERSTLISDTDGFFHGLAIDALERKLYWTDAMSHRIRSVDLSGNNHQVISLGIESHPFGIIVMDTSIYWTDQKGTRKLMRADKATGLNVSSIGSLDLIRPNGMHGIGSTTPVNNECSINNGGCSGVCLPRLVGRSCFCADGLLANEDGTCDTADISTLEITSRPSDVTLRVGMEISQICSSNKPSATIQWMKDGEPLPLGQSGNLYVLPDGGLHILDVDETHRGFYSCIVTAADGAVAQANAEFQFDPDDIFLLTPDSALIPEGDNYILTCSARKASHSIRWEKNGAPLAFTDMVHVVSGDSLIIRQAIVSDAGIYTCYAETLVGSVRVAEARAKVRVTSQQRVEEVCGKVTSPEATEIENKDGEQTYRIIGGTTAKRGSSPWIARIWLSKERTHYCGGTLLNRYWVLTGAHCISKYSVTDADIKIRLGDHDSYSNEDSELLIGVQHIKVHDAFVADDFDTDLALIKLTEPVVDFTDYLRPVCLPSKALAKELLVTGRMGNVVGWGRMTETGPYPRYLREVELPVVAKRKCRNSTDYLITENMFCAGYNSKPIDSCGGDSGGPFSIEHEGRWYQLGIVSWGEGCARQGKYGFYTRLVKFIKWIHRYMEEN